MAQNKMILYQNTDTKKLFTLQEINEWYVEKNSCELPIPDDEMELIILTQLSGIYGPLIVVDDKDPILKWCNDYATHQEAERYLTQQERDESVKNIYESIVSRKKDMLLENIRESICDDKELTSRLEKLL